MAREFGSGGGPIAGKLAARLGWRPLDNAVVERIARVAHVDRKLGRGSQCIPGGRRDAFPVYVYGSWEERLRRVRERSNAAQLSRAWPV